MQKRIFVLLIIIITLILIYLKFFEKEKIVEEKISKNDETYSSNILENVEYISKDVKGNEYLIKAKRGEIDFKNSNIIFISTKRGNIIFYPPYCIPLVH